MTVETKETKLVYIPDTELAQELEVSQRSPRMPFRDAEGRLFIGSGEDVDLNFS